MRKLLRRLMLNLSAILPSNFGSTVPKKAEEDNRIRHKDERLDVAVRKTRMWVSIFPKLTKEQREDPEIHKIMPWQGRGNFEKMAEITKEQWDPETIKAKAEAKGKLDE